MIENFYIVAKRLNKEIEEFLKFEEDGEDVTQEEREMFENLQTCNDSIREYMETQKQIGRKFEEGKCYLDNNFKVRKITKITDRSIFVDGVRYEKTIWWSDNEVSRRADLEA